MKLIKTFIAVVLLAITGGASAKAILSNETEDRHLSGFKAVNVAGSYDVYITQGAVESVKVEASADVIGYITTEVNNGVLKIYNKDHFNLNKFKILGKSTHATIYISVKDINSIELTGSGNVYFKEGLTANNLKLHLTGSGNVTGKLDAKTLESSITGSGDIKISGHADNSKVSVTGSGDYSARGLTTTNTVAHVGGSGNADVNASESLEASVTGSGDVHYGGNPKNVSKSKTGSGDISKL